MSCAKQRIRTHKYSSDDHHQMDITDALVQFIVQDLQPLSVVDSTAFQHLLLLLDPAFKVSTILYILVTNKLL